MSIATYKIFTMAKGIFRKHTESKNKSSEEKMQGNGNKITIKLKINCLCYTVDSLNMYHVTQTFQMHWSIKHKRKRFENVYDVKKMPLECAEIDVVYIVYSHNLFVFVCCVRYNYELGTHFYNFHISMRLLMKKNETCASNNHKSVSVLCYQLFREQRQHEC